MTTPPKAIHGRERLAAGVVGLVHAGVVGAGLALLDHPLLSQGTETVILVVGLVAVGVVVAWLLWAFGSVSPVVVVGTAFAVGLIGDLVAPPSIATFEGQTLVVGTSTLAVYANAWPALLTVGSVLGLAERLIVAESVSRVWSLPLSQYRALAIGGLVGMVHVAAVFALVEVPLEDVSGLLGFIGLIAFATGLVATYAFLHWRYLFAPAFVLVVFFVVGIHAAWPTPGDAALGYGYVQPIVLVAFAALVGIERGWRTLRDRNG